jgi:hypothetical protein
MPFKSEEQSRYVEANKVKLERQDVGVKGVGRIKSRYEVTERARRKKPLKSSRLIAHHAILRWHL